MRRGAAGHTLVPTALVHEVSLRLAGGLSGPPVEWEGRGHAVAVAARLMRQILDGHARPRARQAGGGARAVTLGQAVDAAYEASGVGAADVLALHDALERLAALDPEQARFVEVRHVAGLTVAAAAAMGVSPAAAKREWAVAHARPERAFAECPLAGRRGTCGARPTCAARGRRAARPRPA